MNEYGRRIIIDRDFDVALTDLTNAMRAEGVDVITRFDVRRFLSERLHRDFRRYALLQVSPPQVLLDGLRTDLDVGPVLPAPIAVYELADGETAIEVGEAFGAVSDDAGWRKRMPEMAALADAEHDRIGRALARLAALASV